MSIILWLPIPVILQSTIAIPICNLHHPYQISSWAMRIMHEPHKNLPRSVINCSLSCPRYIASHETNGCARSGPEKGNLHPYKMCNRCRNQFTSVLEMHRLVNNTTYLPTYQPHGSPLLHAPECIRAHKYGSFASRTCNTHFSSTILYDITGQNMVGITKKGFDPFHRFNLLWTNAALLVDAGVDLNFTLHLLSRPWNHGDDGFCSYCRARPDRTLILTFRRIIEKTIVMRPHRLTLVCKVGR